MYIEDSKEEFDISSARVSEGDILVDSSESYFLIVRTHDRRYTFVNLKYNYINEHAIFDTISEVVQFLDEQDEDKIIELIPARESTFKILRGC